MEQRTKKQFRINDEYDKKKCVKLLRIENDFELHSKVEKNLIFFYDLTLFQQIIAPIKMAQLLDVNFGNRRN